MGVMKEIARLCGKAFDDGPFRVQAQSGSKPLEGPLVVVDGIM